VTFETETIDKLFLELSQFVGKGTFTARELALRKDVAEWLQLAKHQRSWFGANHPDGKNAGPCPTDAAIQKSERLLYGEPAGADRHKQ